VAKRKTLTKQESLDLFEEIITCIQKQKKGFFTLEKLKGVHGYCEWEDGIRLDYRKDFIPTIIHECIHLMYPLWTESQVCYSEKRVVNTISSDDVVRLLMFFVKKL
jgi:hypothetical protein